MKVKKITKEGITQVNYINPKNFDKNTMTLVTLNEQKPNTCGSCLHTDNDLGLVALYCDLIERKEENNWGKVRSWHKCRFKPSKYQSR